VAKVWQDLPAEMRAAVMSMVRAAKLPMSTDPDDHHQ
jgi:hypothetical protein